MSILFISDLHLQAQDLRSVQAFTNLLYRGLNGVKAVYILGDLFEAWIGDDDQSAFNKDVIKAIRNISAQGIAVYFMHGNRDFLIGERFAKAAGCELLTDPTVIDLYGRPTLLMHGDTLCTDDQVYLKRRAEVRTPDYIAYLLRKPLWLRRLMAKYYRYKSRKYTRSASTEIMDTSLTEIKRVMQSHQVQTLIHGHTHRPGIHCFELDSHFARCYVLSDWHQQAHGLWCYEDGRMELKYY